MQFILSDKGLQRIVVTKVGPWEFILWINIKYYAESQDLEEYLRLKMKNLRTEGRENKI